jgi:hypothetical protein
LVKEGSLILLAEQELELAGKALIFSGNLVVKVETWLKPLGLAYKNRAILLLP